MVCTLVLDWMALMLLVGWQEGCPASKNQYHWSKLKNLVNLATYGRRAFAYAGPTSWNSLLDRLMDINLTLQTFKRHLKTFLFATY